MRPQSHKDYISSHLIDPFSIEKFLNDEEINELVNLYKEDKTKNYKNTGPVTVDVIGIIKDHPTLKKIFSRIKSVIGECEVYAAFLFYVEIPHIVHNDDAYNYPLIHKGIAIPLQINYESENTGYPSLCFFDQHYLEGPSKFFQGSRNIPTFYNKCIYDYADVQNKSSEKIDSEIKGKYFTHIKDQWLEGLSFNSAQSWVPGNAIFFDCARLHAASDFKAQGIKSKLGLSIFTCLDPNRVISEDVVDEQELLQHSES
jgi:hypothetical protein